MNTLRKVAFAAALILSFALHRRAAAHVDWLRANAPDPEIISLYQFGGLEQNTGEIQAASGCLGEGLGLEIGPSVGLGALVQTDTKAAIFNPHSFKFRSAQSMQSADDAHELDGDLTIEFWLKWDSAATSSSFEVGFLEGAKIRMTRHNITPAADQFGITGTHGDYIAAAAFTNWIDVGTEEAPQDEWIHVAMTIHSTGLTYDTGLAHDVYNPGSTARFYLNGHPTGAAPHTVSIAGLRSHDDSAIVIRNIAGLFSIDEVTLWRKDWSDDGANTNPFADGRGSGKCIEWTRVNTPSPATLALYEFNDAAQLPGETLSPGSCIDPARGLLITAVSGGAGMAIQSTDWPEPIFQPNSMTFDGTQSAESTATLLGGIDGDLTIEGWVKWDSAATSSTVEFGLRSGAKIRLTRDQGNPANDRFGVQGTHGSYISAPGFTNWAAIPGRAPLDTWLHVALTIHPTGIVYDTLAAHDVYDVGSVGTFWLNGYPVGPGPHEVDFAGLKVHPTSKLRIGSLGGNGVALDEVTLWNRDWSEGGEAVYSFFDGRGTGVCNGVEGWASYE